MASLVSHNTDIQSAISAEKSLPAGNYEVRFYLSEPLKRQDISDAKEYLISQGVNSPKVYQGRSGDVWYLAVQYSRQAPGEGITALPVAIIPLIAMGMIVAIIGVGIFKLEEIGKVLLIGGGILIVSLALLRKPIEKYVEKM